jgi:prevent-host-death family protein
MISIGAFEAKTHLSSLLDRAAGGEEIIITKHGKPLAKLVSAGNINSDRSIQAMNKLRESRKGLTLGGIAWKELRDEGRK